PVSAVGLNHADAGEGSVLTPRTFLADVRVAGGRRQTLGNGPLLRCRTGPADASRVTVCAPDAGQVIVLVGRSAGRRGQRPTAEGDEQRQDAQRLAPPAGPANPDESQCGALPTHAFPLRRSGLDACGRRALSRRWSAAIFISGYTGCS